MEVLVLNELFFVHDCTNLLDRGKKEEKRCLKP